MEEEAGDRRGRTMIMSAGGGVLRHQGRGSRSLTGLMVVEGLETKEEAALEIITSEPLTTRSPTRNRARWPASKGRGLGLVLARAASGGGSPSPSPGSSSCTDGLARDEMEPAEEAEGGFTTGYHRPGSDGECEGLPVVHLSFEGLTCSYEYPPLLPPIVTLQGASGSITSGGVTVIMGPSGSGKSTLLDIIAQRKTVGRVTGSVKINGLKCLRARSSGSDSGDSVKSSSSSRDVITPSQFRRLSAYVAQEDLFLPTLTVAETVVFHMGLRLGPASRGEGSRMARCLALLSEVGIYEQRNNLVGGQLAGGLSLRGLSGGQRRRLSIACGIVTQPPLLFLDEPTSGLDAMSAVVVMDILKRQARRGVAVLCTLHQPRAVIWRMIDKLILLSEGRLIWAGRPGEAEAWFNKLGFERPPDSSVADFLLDLVNISFGDQFKSVVNLGCKAMRTMDDLDKAALIFKESNASSLLTPREGLCRNLASTSWLRSPRTSLKPGSLARLPFELRHLLWRTSMNYLKNPGNAAARIAITTLIALLQGVAFYRLSPHDAYNRLSALFFACMSLSLAPYCSMSLFIYDRQFYVRDLAAGLYSATAYYWGSVLVEGCLSVILGLIFASITYYMVGLQGSFSVFVVIQVGTILVASQLAQVMALLTPNQDLAFGLGCAYTTISLLVSGFFVSYPSLGPLLRPFQWLSYPKYTLAAMAINEFWDTPAYPTIHAHLDPPSLLHDLGALAIVSVVAFVISILSLRHLHWEKR